MLDPSTTTSGVASPRCSRCSECKKPFRPHPRLTSRQKTCGQKICQLKQRARFRRAYRAEHPGPDKEYADKAKTNRPKNYWKNYRKNNPKATERNRFNTRLRKRLSRAGLQRQLDIVQVFDPPGFFDLFQQFATSHRSLIKSCAGIDAQVKE